MLLFVTFPTQVGRDDHSPALRGKYRSAELARWLEDFHQPGHGV
jgi:hypothetical protein